jgi:hypothetical protein
LPLRRQQKTLTSSAPAVIKKIYDNYQATLMARASGPATDGLLPGGLHTLLQVFTTACSFAMAAPG